MPPSSSPPSVPDDAVLASWLTEEPTKLLLARVGEHVSAWRTALVVLVSACAYVGVAALGHVQADWGTSPDPGILYMLRWETLESNRVQPREPVPPSTTLRLYAVRQ